MRVQHWLRVTVVTSVSAAILLATVGVAVAAAPIKETLFSYLGHEVDSTTGGDYCLAKGADECKPGKESAALGGFTYPKGVGGAPGGNIYVGDSNNRVQELTPDGQPVLVFGREVDKTTGADICTVVSKDTCGAGIYDSGASGLKDPESIAVDQNTGDVYVEDLFNWRIDKYSPTGEFILAFGKEVDATTHTDICTAASKDTCQAGVRGSEGRSTEGGIFNFLQSHGDLIAVGGPGGLVYVGDEHRVQEYETDGKYKTEISLRAISSAPESYVTALAVDPGGRVFLVYREGLNSGLNIVRKFEASGLQVEDGAFPIVLKGTENQSTREIGGLAVDSEARLAVAETEAYPVGNDVTHIGIGTLYDTGTALVSTHFSNPRTPALAFTGLDAIFAVAEVGLGIGHELWGYEPLPVAELITRSQACGPGGENDTDVILDCMLHGEVNPEDVPKTFAWFEWGRSPVLGETTPRQDVPTGSLPVDVQALVEARPNESAFYYRLAGEDENAPAPELLSGATESFTTPIVSPWTGVPKAKFVTASSAVLSDELNPENGDAVYAFEYMPGRCPQTAEHPNAQEIEEREEFWVGSGKTRTSESDAYGKIGTTQEATALQPETEYCYRLHVRSTNTAKDEQLTSTSAELSLTTGRSAVPRVSMGSATAIGTTSAVIAGEVDPDGQPATYSFEVGLYKGDATQYGVVSSGSAGAGSAFTPVSLTLVGLQPGTTYAYRLAIHSGYVTGADAGAVGTPSVFMTASIPLLLQEKAPVQLRIPPIPFPRNETPCKRGYKRDKHGKCVKNQTHRAAKRKAKKGRKTGGRGHGVGARKISGRKLHR